VSGFFDVDALGVRVRVDLAEIGDEAQREQMRRSWSGAVCADEGDPEANITPVPGANFDAAMERTTIDVTLAALKAQSGRMLMFHAAGVADDTGRVAAFIGPSGAGKTTLSGELGRHAGYVSDETIAIGRGLAVSPYRKPLSIVRPGAPKRQVSPADAGLQHLPDAPLRLASLVLMARDPDAETAEIEQVGLAEALPELVSQMSYLRDQERPLQAIAAVCDAVGGVRRLRYRDTSSVPALLPQLFASGAGNSCWAPAPDVATTGPFHADDVLDALVVEHQVLVMTPDRVQVLDGIAPTIWLTATAGGDEDRIVRAVEAEFGPAPDSDSRALVSAALDELVAVGVLGRRGGSGR